MAVVLKGIQNEMMHSELVATVAAGTAYGPLGIDDEPLPLATCIPATAWVDDLAVPIFGPALTTHRKSAQVLAVVWNSFRRHAMELNMGEGKTAVMVHYGARSPKLPGARPAGFLEIRFRAALFYLVLALMVQM